jgi:signal peptidase I
MAGYLVAIILTWHLSRAKAAGHPWYARWYSIIGAMTVAWLIGFAQTDDDLRRYRNFYTPAQSMAPTLLKNDRFIAYMQGGEFHRGDMVLVPTHRGDIYIKRIAALPGDRIAMRDGQVVLNGSSVAQRFRRTERIKDGVIPLDARRLQEQFPGEARPHEIYDYGASPGDEMPEQTVRPDHIFLLGDNRDRSADSRFSQEDSGLEQVPIASVAGRPLYFSWGSSRPMGSPLSRD